MDSSILRKFCHRHLCMFEFSPIVGAFSITVKLVCCPTNKSFHLTNIYGPSNVVDRTYFIFCCYNFDTSQIYSRGDINLIRSRDNRNRPRGNVNDLAEISLEGRASLWSSIKSDRLVEKLEWVFTSSLWVIFIHPLQCRCLVILSLIMCLLWSILELTYRSQLCFIWRITRSTS